MTDVMDRVRKHYNKAVEHYGEENIFGVFCYGSWNYGTNTPDSDVDTKCILIPDLYHLALKPYEVKHLHVDDEICECMTIMHMVENWKKQNINFLEILFTPYCILNEDYADLWCGHREAEWEHPMTLGMAELVARYDVKKAVMSMSGQALRTIRQDPTDLKKIMNGARIMRSLAILTSNPTVSYIDVIRATPKIAGIRTGETKIEDGFIEEMISYFEYMMAHADDFAHLSSDKHKVDEYLNKFVLQMIRQRIALD